MTATCERLPYNSTIITIKGGRQISACAGHVDGCGYVLRSSAVQCTGVEDTRAYHDRFLSTYPRSEADSVVAVEGTEGLLAFVRDGAVDLTNAAVI